MLNFIWLGLIVVAVLLGGFTGKVGDVSDAAIAGAKAGLEIAWGLVAIMTLWLGLMRLAEKAGLVARLGLALKPIMIWLFPDVPPNHPAMGAIVMNMAANILGLNNAATPLGLRAMAELEKLNRRPGIATNAMCMLLAINTSSITLIPVTVIGLLSIAHGKNPTIVIGTSLAATAIAHICAILTAKLLEKSPFYRLAPLPVEPLAVIEDEMPAPVGIESTGSAASDSSTEEFTRTDAALPWVPGARWILAAFAGIFLGMTWGYAFPDQAREIYATFFAPPSDLAPLALDPRPDLLRLVSAVSLLAIPWLIVFIPVYAALRRIPVYEQLVEGGREGFTVMLRILPYVVGMFVAIFMFRAAGGMELITQMVSPLTNLLHFPSELVPLAIIRPFSGTASLGLLADLIHQHGPDAPITLAAGTFYGCSETTFYVIAVYFGSVNIRRTRHAIPAGLVADFVGPIASVMICRWMFGPF